jgi:hypothetical protein
MNLQRPKKQIVLLGIMSRKPVAGVVWQVLHYLLGFRRLGYDVYYVEAHGLATGLLMEHGEEGSFTAAAFIDGVMRRFGLRQWLIVLCAVVSSGFAQVAAPQYGALVFALVTGPALLAGLIFETGTALLREYVARRRQAHGRQRGQNSPPSTARESSDKESSES